MPVDGVLGEAQLAGDLLGAHVAIDQPQALALTLCEAVEIGDLIGQGGVDLVHRQNFTGTPRLGQASAD